MRFDAVIDEIILNLQDCSGSNLKSPESSNFEDMSESNI